MANLHANSENALNTFRLLNLKHAQITPATGHSNCVKVISVSVSDLDVLQPVGWVWGGGQGEVVSGCHPRLQALQLSGGSVSGHMTHQVALELV